MGDVWPLFGDWVPFVVVRGGDVVNLKCQKLKFVILSVKCDDLCLRLGFKGFFVRGSLILDLENI